MSYLTAIKDYRGIMLSFLAAIAVTFLSGALLPVSYTHQEMLGTVYNDKEGQAREMLNLAFVIATDGDLSLIHISSIPVLSY